MPTSTSIKRICLLTSFILTTLFLTNCSLVSPADPTPTGPFPTPTPIISLTQTSELDSILPAYKPIIQQTAVPFDLDAALAAERDAEIDFDEFIQGTTIIINIDANATSHEISPLIYGVAGASESYLRNARIPLNKWGGDLTARYNWRLGNAWNGGFRSNYTNTNLGYVGNDAAVDFMNDSQAAESAVQVTLPTIGWAAKDNNIFNCSFALNGVCTSGQSASCQSPLVTADPTITSIPTDVANSIEFVRHLQQEVGDIDIISVAHEPELWGTVHYDVHPECTTYDEVLSNFIDHAVQIKALDDNIELAGPSTSGWEFYWTSAAGQDDPNSAEEFLPWFLEEMQEHDEAAGQRHLDILDIHYTRDVTGIGEADARLRSTNSLWSRAYKDEGEIREAIYLIPRMQELIAEHYPDTKLGIGEWTFGNEWDVNGALAMADAIGIFGRENLYYATHAYHPAENTPGYYAFKIFTNYNNVGGKFGDQSIPTSSTHPDYVSAYSAIDSTSGNLHVIIINKLSIFSFKEISVNVRGFTPDNTIRQYVYDGPTFQGVEDGIAFDTVEVELRNNGFSYTLTPYSIYHLVLRPVDLLEE